MSSISESQLNEALDACAKEKIATPNAVQPHGFLLSLDPKGRRVLRASENCANLFELKVNEILQCSADDLFTAEFLNAILSRSGTHERLSTRVMSTTIGQQDFDAVVHRVNNELIVELEPKLNNSTPSSKNALFNLEAFCAGILDSEDMESLLNTLAADIRKATGFDRVKVYEFDDSWNGKIVAEDKEASMASYLGLHFPAADIPPQARALYTQNLLRLIADVDYEPIKICQSASYDDALDMSESVLRSVSPVHLQYLKNMGVGASMSVSILLDGELWGLVVCHHAQSRFVDYRVRVLCEIMSHVFSARLSSLRKQSLLANEKDLQAIVSKLNTDLDANDRSSVFSGADTSMMTLMHADGMVIFEGGQLNRCGLTPDEDNLHRLSFWYANFAVKKVYDTQDIAALLLKSGVDVDMSGGAIIAPIGFDESHFVCWFRRPKVAQVSWAGDPEKPPELVKGAYRLTPRSSFDLWKTEVKHKSTPWEPECVRAAEYIAAFIQENDKRRANASNLAKSDFLSHMSHELRTPLSAISSIIQVLVEEPEVNDSVRGLITTLDMSARSLLSIVNDVLDVNKIEAGSMKLDPSEFTPEELLEEVRSVMHVQAHEKGLSFNVHYGDGATTAVISDMVKIRQVLFNLASNAIKYTDAGFINVSCSLEPLKHTDNKAELKIEVSDSGIGISDENIVRIFDKFEQGSALSERNANGSGLGLSICKSFAELMQGYIEATSKVGMGSRFTFAIPVLINREKKETEQQVTRSEKTPSIVTSGLREKRVLLCEDYQGNIVAILHFLQSKGFDVTIAKNGKEAVEKVRESDFDIILMDVQMPILDGISASREICKLLRAENRADIAIIGMTANAMQDDRANCIRAGMSDYISKPLKLGELLEKIHQNTKDL